MGNRHAAYPGGNPDDRLPGVSPCPEDEASEVPFHELEPAEPEDYVQEDYDPPGGGADG
jgi:hypothetical protein